MPASRLRPLLAAALVILSDSVAGLERRISPDASGPVSAGPQHDGAAVEARVEALLRMSETGGELILPM